MLIKTEIELNENKLEEFTRVLLPEIEDEVLIIDNSDENYINLEARNSFNSVVFSYKKIEELGNDQKETMSKIILLKLYNKNYLWGGIIGVRPTKLVYKFLNFGFSYEKIYDILINLYLISPEKAEKLIEIVKNSIEFLDNETIGVYIGIAFCPTKCTYCSFPAYLKKGKYEKRYDDYINCLIEEIEEIGKLITKFQKKINILYIGGGTPSFLSHLELELMLKTIYENYDLSNLKEFTFEAGRIDTLDEEKLDIMVKYGVDRISLNPQSFKESTLKLVNRYHDINYFEFILEKAHEKNLSINMDFIIGLPKETTEDVLSTIEQIKKYDVENITFHNLALKKSSYLNKNNYVHEKLDYKKINKKIEEGMKLKELIPYYIYRQKNSYEWGENIGYCKKGMESIYNIEMIEENNTIVGIGAGSITKIITPNNILRIVSPKDPIMWVNEFSERLENKKQKIEEFFKGEI